jgi:hypothetical protein
LQLSGSKPTDFGLRKQNTGRLAPRKARHFGELGDAGRTKLGEY